MYKIQQRAHVLNCGMMADILLQQLYCYIGSIINNNLHEGVMGIF